jgi:hypothetical protein
VSRSGRGGPWQQPRQAARPATRRVPVLAGAFGPVSLTAGLAAPAAALLICAALTTREGRPGPDDNLKD